MKHFCYLTAATLVALNSASQGVTLLSQDWDTDPVNYTLPGISDPFRFQVSDPTRYWGPTSMPGVTPNPAVTGASGNYLGAQNMNNDGDGTLTFDTATAPGQVDFAVSVSGFTSLQLSIALAGMPTAETENYLRGLVDLDGDAFYETTLFNFQGSNNSPYVDIGPNGIGQLDSVFQTFTVNIPDPVGGNLRFRLEIFNDTNSQNEAQGVDSILISGVPEPSAALLAGVAALGLLRRRR